MMRMNFIKVYFKDNIGPYCIFNLEGGAEHFLTKIIHWPHDCLVTIAPPLPGTPNPRINSIFLKQDPGCSKWTTAISTAWMTSDEEEVVD